MKIKNFFSENNNSLQRPYIIAEAGVNHEGSIEIAKRLIYEAKKGNADAIKFQTYKASTLASKDSPAYWDLKKEKTNSQYKLFKKYDKFWKKEFELLKNECDKVDIEFLSTPFDIESSIFLNDLMQVFKISSSDITNKPFIKFICNFNKPIILSTGASNTSEIEEAVNWISQNGNILSLLHCILNYPTLNKNANLLFIKELIKKYPNYIIGYSDHTLPENMDTVFLSYVLGAKIIEKHFTHDKSLPGNDHYHAMDYKDLINLNEKINNFLELLGSNIIDNRNTENLSRKNARRSLVLSKNLLKGEILSYSNLTWKRPATGISPSLIDNVIGKRITCNLDEDSILKWEHIDQKM